MKREIITTSDGSHTISIPDLNSTYHSKHGAAVESQHVFIESGLKYFIKTNNWNKNNTINIFEFGFGTGLNALLTTKEAEGIQLSIYYETIEPFPLTPHEYSVLNYCRQLQQPNLTPAFEQLHLSGWENEIKITPNFTFRKSMNEFFQHSTNHSFHLVYFDAFAPTVQPELWSTAIFKKLFQMMEPGGLLLTYCSKSAVRKSMTEAGFTVHKIQGPPHKREMVRAIKNI